MCLVTFQKWKQIQVIKMMSSKSRRGINKADNWRNGLHYYCTPESVLKEFWAKLPVCGSYHMGTVVVWNQPIFEGVLYIYFYRNWCQINFMVFAKKIEDYSLCNNIEYVVSISNKVVKLLFLSRWKMHIKHVEVHQILAEVLSSLKRISSAH